MKGFQIKHLGQIKWEKKGADLDMWQLEKRVKLLKERDDNRPRCSGGCSDTPTMEGESKSGGIPAKKKNGTLDLRYKKNIETLEKQKVI